MDSYPTSREDFLLRATFTIKSKTNLVFIVLLYSKCEEHTLLNV